MPRQSLLSSRPQLFASRHANNSSPNRPGRSLPQATPGVRPILALLRPLRKSGRAKNPDISASFATKPRTSSIVTFRVALAYRAGVGKRVERALSSSAIVALAACSGTSTRASGPPTDSRTATSASTVDDVRRRPTHRPPRRPEFSFDDSRSAAEARQHRHRLRRHPASRSRRYGELARPPIARTRRSSRRRSRRGTTPLRRLSRPTSTYLRDNDAAVIEKLDAPTTVHDPQRDGRRVLGAGRRAHLGAQDRRPRPAASTSERRFVGPTTYLDARRARARPLVPRRVRRATTAGRPPVRRVIACRRAGGPRRRRYRRRTQSRGR